VSLARRRHAIAPLMALRPDAIMGVESVEYRTFDSDERRLQEEIMRELYRECGGWLNRDSIEALAGRIIENQVRPHIHRTIEDALA
jgi:hypothetical protein